MSTIKVIFQKLPASELDFQQKLKSVTESKNELHDQFSEIQQLNIKQAVIGPNHFAFLTDDGRVCRIGFSMPESALGKEKKDSGKIVPRDPLEDIVRRQGRAISEVNAAARRGRNLIAASRIRPGGPGRPVDESLAVPEERIQQCQAVLAGKSRDIIKRELQRTNLDVNAAINNILSRDEGEDSPGTFPGPAGLGTLISTFSHSEDLFNLIDDPERSGLLDDILGRRRIMRRQARHGAAAAARDSKNPPSFDEPPIKLSRGLSNANEISYDIVEWWPTGDKSISFNSIVSLHNELLSLDSNGRLHQWNWEDTLPFQSTKNKNQIFHPKTDSLGLLKEEVIQISGSVCRASFITKSNKVGTLCDSSIAGYSSFFEHKATVFPEFTGINLSSAQLHTCSQWTLLQVKNDVYWWGVIPYDHRARAIEKIRKNPGGNKKEKIQLGSMVVYKKQPYYRAGTKALKLLDNEPRIGILNQDIFKMDEAKAEFKICRDEDSKG